jgi:membrane-associated PAP2 superfamily phosphatase
MKRFFVDNAPWLLPVLLTAAITPFSSQIDMAVSNYFFHLPEGFSTNGIFSFIYRFGPYPSFLLFAIATAALIASFFKCSLASWRKPALVLFLTYAIGAGLITHVFLKDHWGRPRPKQVQEFATQKNEALQPFRPYYSPNFFHQPTPSKSFPCGHCTCGFYFFALGLVGMRLKNKTLCWFGFLTAILLGGALSLTRIAQGGHFFTDTLMTAEIMWLTAYFTDKLVYISKSSS